MDTQAPTQDRIRAGWEAVAPGFDEFVTPQTLRLAEDALRRIDLRPGMRLLDVGAGSGALAIPAARLGARVVAADIAPTMIERLRDRAAGEGLSNLDGRVMDGQALEFEDGAFDVSASLNGVSLFPDMAGGLAELVRVTRPGGRVLVVAFGPLQKAEFLGFLVKAMQATVAGFAPPPVDPPPLPFQVADLELLRGKLTGAGLTGVTVDTTTWEMRFESAAHFWNTFTSGNPVWRRLTGGLTSEQQADVRWTLTGMFRERSAGAPGAELHTEVNVGIGTK
ncbi:class I SAM-dependent methyltransferase [Allosalinactinospora lopnorensis]|uniref:class I SAM-dependent methyltransferase n=1 Tax=Allosalinactinospora lopnorensis TaxID=1352348 RepID=UPI000623E3E6|nr:methyltransferase domain-containing protein [Allosalinactinospora lopnorensis]